MQKINNQQKRLLLFLGMLFCVFLTHRLAFSKTWAAFQTSQKLERSLNQSSTATAQIRLLQKELEQYQNHFAFQEKSDSNTLDFREQLLANIAHFSSLSIQQFNQANVKEERDLMISTHHLQVTGHFKEVLQLVYKLEEVQHLGEVLSLNFSLEQNRKTRQSYLLAELHIQQVEPTKKAKHESSKQ